MTFELLFSYFFRLEYSAVEVLVLTLLFCRGHSHRGHFPLRLAAWAVLTLAYSLFAGWLYALSVGTPVYLAVRSLVYLSVYVVATSVSFFCYRERFSEMIICSVSGVAAQCVSSNISNILGLDYYGWVSGIGSGLLRMVLYQLLYYLCNAPAYVVIYLIFARRRDRVPEREKNYVYLPLSVVVLLFDCVMSGLVQYYSGESAALSLLAECFAALCGVFVLILNNSLTKLFVTREDLRISEMLQYQEQKQYEQLRRSMEMVNIKCHDIKHFVSSYAGRADPGELESLSRLARSFDSYVSTNNAVLDVILNEKEFVCGQKGITFVCMGDASPLSYMSDADLYSLFGNALDNAIEATEKLEDAERRKIDLNLSRSQGGIVLSVINFCDGDLRQENGIFKTSKEDRDFHGFGMLSMDSVARKYGGRLTAGSDDGMFRLDVWLPIREAAG